jgi:ATP-dependent RNA helicase RhlE
VAKDALRDPVRIDLAPPTRPAAGITQAVYPVPKHLKTDLLDTMLSQSEMTSVLVFARTKHGADRLTRDLARRGHSVTALHGNRSQSQRERALGDLRRGRVQALVATDIASRGIDVEGITHVINYDVPHVPEDYVHRIGRTGRVDAVGDAFTLVSPEEQKQLATIERFLGRAIPRVVLPDFDYKRRGAEPGAGARPPRRGERRDGGRAREPWRGDRAQGARPGGVQPGRNHGPRAGAHPRGSHEARAGGAHAGRSNEARAPRTHDSAESRLGPAPASPDARHGRRPRRDDRTDRRNRRRI